MTRNDDYYGEKPKIDQIEETIILDSSTRLNKYKAGSLDTLTLDHSQLAGAEADPKLKSEISYRLRPAVFYVGMNQGKVPVLRDARVRKAIGMAIDRAKICRDLLHGVPEARTLIAPGVPGDRKEFTGLAYDPAAAKKLLAEAGFPDGKGFPEISFTIREKTPDSQIVAESIESQLRQNLGISIKPTVLQWGTYLAARDRNELQMYFLSWYADYLDAQNFLSLLLHSTSPLNHDGFKNPEFDRLVSKADALPDEVTRQKLYQQAEDLAIMNAVRIPMYFQRDAVLVNPRAKGLKYNLMGNLPATSVRLN